MPRAVLAQAFCPQGHTIFAIAGFAEDDPYGTPEKDEQVLTAWDYLVMKATLDAVDQKKMDPWCAICKADWKTWKAQAAFTGMN